jgi:hypothetical protein
VPDDRIGAFLMANGIRDATRVPLGFEYRVPNPLAPRLSALAGQVDELQRSVAARTARTTELEHEVQQLQSHAALAAEKEVRLQTLEHRWPIALTALIVALLGLAGALWTARLAAWIWSRSALPLSHTSSRIGAAPSWPSARRPVTGSSSSRTACASSSVSRVWSAAAAEGAGERPPPAALRRLPCIGVT